MRHFTLQYRILVHLAHYKSISMIITHDTSDCHADRGWYTRDYLFPPLYWKDNYLEWSCLFFFYY